MTEILIGTACAWTIKDAPSMVNPYRIKQFSQTKGTIGANQPFFVAPALSGDNSTSWSFPAPFRIQYGVSCAGPDPGDEQWYVRFFSTPQGTGAAPNNGFYYPFTLLPSGATPTAADVVYAQADPSVFLIATGAELDVQTWGNVDAQGHPNYYNFSRFGQTYKHYSGTSGLDMNNLVIQRVDPSQSTQPYMYMEFFFNQSKLHDRMLSFTQNFNLLRVSGKDFFANQSTEYWQQLGWNSFTDFTFSAQ